MNEIMIKKTSEHQRKRNIISDKVDQEVACKILVRFIAKDKFLRQRTVIIRVMDKQQKIVLTLIKMMKMFMDRLMTKIVE